MAKTRSPTIRKPDKMVWLLNAIRNRIIWGDEALGHKSTIQNPNNIVWYSDGHCRPNLDKFVFIEMIWFPDARVKAIKVGILVLFLHGWAILGRSIVKTIPKPDIGQLTNTGNN